MTLPYFKVVMSFLKKKVSNNQDIFVVVLMLINMYMANKYFVLAKFTYSYKGDISVFP